MPSLAIPEAKGIEIELAFVHAEDTVNKRGEMEPPELTSKASEPTTGADIAAALEKIFTMQDRAALAGLVDTMRPKLPVVVASMHGVGKPSVRTDLIVDVPLEVALASVDGSNKGKLVAAPAREAEMATRSANPDA